MSVPGLDVDRELTAKTPARIQAMFDGIAPRYDLLNKLLSAGFDRRWRTRAVGALAPRGGERILDLCTGTADLALAVASQLGDPARLVVGLDFSADMLDVGRRKLVARARPAVLVRGDAVHLPMSSGVVDAVTVAFGVRNVVDLPAALREMRRVLRPGGRLVVLEFGLPGFPGLRAAYAWYLNYVLPRVGAWLSRDSQAYSYLPVSVGNFPAGERFVELVRTAGFERVEAVPLTAGIVYLYTAWRPCAAGDRGTQMV